MSSCNKLSFLLFAAFLTLSFNVRSQSQLHVTGSVIDSVKKPIEGVTVKLITEKDTLKSTTDAQGNFSFSKVGSNKFYMELSALGYKAFAAVYEVENSKKIFALEPVILKTETVHLKDIEIKAKVDPIKFKKDTVEYNAAAYTVRRDDMVEDLLRQLQGIEIDKNGSVTAMGKKMTKLRVNGVDFFTGNVEDYIRQLPADIIAKIQVIDDYGDLANFTGVKTGTPQKMLNLVTKPGMDNGIFGSVHEQSSTSNAHTLGANANIWKQTKQIGLGTSYGLANNDITTSKNKNLNGNIRTPISKGISFNGSYSLGNNSNQSSGSQYLQTVSSEGNIYDLQESNHNSSGWNNMLNLGLQGSNKTDFFTLALGATLNNNNNAVISTSNKTGLIRQDLYSNSGSGSSSPNINGNIQYSRRLKDNVGSLSMGFNFGRGKGNSASTINDIIKYYNVTTNLLVKDSLLNRLVNSNNLNTNVGGSIQFSKSLKKARDSTGSSFLSLSYNFSVNKSENGQVTRVADAIGNVFTVDSLSQHYISTSISQNISLNYNGDAKKYSYSFSINFTPNILTGRYPNTNETLENYQMSFSPGGNISYRLKENASLSAGYSGSTRSPDFNQLQPIKNSNNVQNIIVGNPNLKGTTTHGLNLGYNKYGLKSGLGMMLGISGDFTINSAVSKTVFLKDTLNSLKQLTTYENVNGIYNIHANYSVNKRLANNKLSLGLNGNIGYGHNVFYTDTVLSGSRGINISNSLNCALNKKSFSLGIGASYSFSSNTYSVMNQNISNIQALALNGSGDWVISRKFRFNASASKNFNFGYSLTTGSPLIINMGLNASLLKSNKLGFTVQANDLFNQGVVFSSYVNNNTITQNRTRFISRLVQVTLNYNLNHFGGRKRSI